MIATSLLAFLLLASCGGRVGTDVVHSDMGGGDAGMSSGQGSEGGTGVDEGGSSSSDAAVCVDIDPLTYDQSCQMDPDCLEVTAGHLCSLNCLCGGATIGASDQARYQAALGMLSREMGPLCSCPYLGKPRCVQGQCVFCPASFLHEPRPPGCGDGG